VRALVVGAGLGGLATALALGENATEALVLERAASISEIEVGIGMVVWPNGMRALRRLGVGDEVTALGAHLERVEFSTSAGRHLNTWPVGDLGRRVGEPALALSRGELHSILSRNLRERGTALTLGARVTDFEDSGDGVAVQLDGGSDVQGDVLIGADGLASMVRRKLIGRGPPEYPPYANYTLWHSIIPYDQSVPPGVFFLVFGPGSRFAYYRIDDERVYWSAIAFVPAGNEHVIDKSEVLDSFGEYQDPILPMVEATDEADILRHDIYGGEALERWGSGRVTLLGDAAHPMTTNLGQGAGMAMEDGVVLARCLSEQPEPEAALREYERLRMARTGEMMALANKLNSTAALEGPFRVWLRGVMIRLFFTPALGRKYDGFISRDF
jgi:2-polyprenyl-6-methoxyphenol hydroxylase-like FAD-dependent oxidoreductase